jgi:polyisoprenyl-teichoic acid--peptidoglycan teichoic acid transferase
VHHAVYDTPLPAASGEDAAPDVGLSPESSAADTGETPAEQPEPTPHSPGRQVGEEATALDELCP